MIFILTLILIFLYTISKIFLKKNSNSLVKFIPGPKPIFLFGNAFEFLTNEDPLYTLFRFSSKYGNIFKLWLGSDLFVILSDPADIEVIISNSKYNKKAVSYKYLTNWLGNYSLITSYGNIWHLHRKLLTPTMHFKILENSVGIINHNSKILCNQLLTKTETEEFDISVFIEKCSLDITCETFMGVKMNIQTSENLAYFHAVKNVTKITEKRAFQLWLQSEILFRLSNYYKQFKKSAQIMENISKQVIISRKQKMLQDISSANHSISMKSNTPTPFLDFLLLESNFTDEEINDEVKTFMFASHDTTTTAICFCVYMLSQFPNIQSKAYDEIMRVLPTDNDFPTIRNLGNLKYLENIIKETLRLYPPVPMLGRQILENVKLPSGHELPANCQINLFIYGLHRNPNIFENADKFIPERFDDIKNKHSFSYIPFSAGPRNCIGQKLALLEIKIILSSLLRNYIFLPTIDNKPLILTSELILRSKNGIIIRLKNRRCQI